MLCSEEFAADIIKLGADDYILKDRMARLPSAINLALKQRQIEKENLEKMEQARQKIELAEERERVAIDAANIGIFDLNINTGELMTSQRFDEVFGFDGSELWSDYTKLIHPDDVAISDKAYEMSKITGRLSYETRIIKNDKTLAWVRTEGIIHKDQQGIPERIIGSIMDITEFKYLLKQKDNFIAVASHELKTPVTTIKAYTHILEEKLKNRGDSAEIQLIEKIEKQINKLSGLIDNLLDSTKIISGMVELSKTDFKIDALVAEVITGLRLTSDKKIILELAADDCEVWADKDKIEQVITNLVNNAIKFSPNADKIVVRTFTKNDEVQFVVEDFGIGIKQENIDKIFQEFYREDNDLKYTFPGLGLGLFISSEIIKKEGGEN